MLGPERAGVVRVALARPEVEVAVAALWQLGDLLEAERTDVVHLALAHPDPAVAVAARPAAERC